MEKREIKKYYDIIKIDLQDKSEAIAQIQEAQEKANNDFNTLFIEYREKLQNGELSEQEKETFKERQEEKTAECKRLEEQKEIAEIIQKLDINNLLYIQQFILEDLASYFLTSKYYNKPLGEKTKEKVQNDFAEYLKKEYNGIDLDCYIYESYNNYNEGKTYKIVVYYSDFYYQYELKQEEIHINTKDNTTQLYYYNEVDFITPNNTEKEARKLLMNYKKNYNKIRELEKQIEDIKKTNNEGKTAALDSYRLNCWLNWR